ncbi:MAG: AAA family ATPase, partial [Myxococcales bacterium]|nr:AAA family ATPase [Myxococcales bacterium]
MKLLELSLLAYGPFSGERLDLSAPGLQVVFGPNEAGKSTSLRAITGLLYGIAERTGDNHLHGNKGLRIGGKLSHQGEVLEVVRRKGRRKTLLDPAGDPIDEARLTRMLGGVSRELFLTMFGL